VKPDYINDALQIIVGSGLVFCRQHQRTIGKIPAAIGDTGFLLIPLQAIAPEPESVAPA
jgi:hypothetical protein